jgi:hypothetical protein
MVCVLSLFCIPGSCYLNRVTQNTQTREEKYVTKGAYEEIHEKRWVHNVTIEYIKLYVVHYVMIGYIM